MNVDELRAFAAQCRELLRVAISDDVREQLSHWAEEFDAHAEEMEQETARST